MGNKLLMITAYLLIGVDIAFMVQIIYLGAMEHIWKKKSIGAYKDLYNTCVEMSKQTEELYDRANKQTE